MIIAEVTYPMTQYLSKDYVIVNPVNRTGAMGAGVAKWFRDAMPDMCAAYTHVCKRGWPIGDVLLWRGGIECVWEFQVANVPSKHHWREKSDINLIEQGLTTLDRYAIMNNKTIVTTRIGCGLGGLTWDEVRPLLDVLSAHVIIASGKLDSSCYNPCRGYHNYTMLHS